MCVKSYRCASDHTLLYKYRCLGILFLPVVPFQSSIFLGALHQFFKKKVYWLKLFCAEVERRKRSSNEKVASAKRPKTASDSSDNLNTNQENTDTGSPLRCAFVYYVLFNALSWHF